MTTIAGYNIDIDLDSYDRPCCTIFYGKFHASLACLEDTGFLYGPNDEEHEVPPDVIDRITESVRGQY